MGTQGNSNSPRPDANAPRAAADDSGKLSKADVENPTLARPTPGQEVQSSMIGSGDGDHDKLYFDMLSKVYTGIQEQIRFADTKAGVVAAFNAILVGFIASNLSTIQDLYKTTHDWNVSLWLITFSLLSGIPTAISIGFIIWAVRPRTGRNTHKSRIYFGHIAREYKLDGVRYKNDAYAMRQGDWADDYGYQIVEVANIADEKHSNIRTSINWSFGAFVALVVISLVIHTISVFYPSVAGQPTKQADSLNQPASHASRSLTAGPDGLSRVAPSVSHEGSA